MKTRLSHIFRALGITAIVAANLSMTTVSRAETDKTKVTLGYASMSGAFGSFWIAEEKGYFKEEGLDVTLLFSATTVGLQALSSGHIDAMGSGCAEFFEATRKGYENRVVASLLENNLYLLASAKGITDPKMLIGKTIAVNKIGDTGHLSMRHALRRLGVDPDKITYVQVGSTPERFSALSKGAVAGAIQVGSLRPLVIKSGLHVLIDLQKEKSPSCLGGIGVKAETIKKTPKMVEALLRAIAKGNAYLSDGPAEETKKIFSKYMKLPPTDAKLLLGWSYFSKEAHSRKPKQTIEATKSVMEMMAEADPTWKKEDPSRYVDLSFMEKLDKSGYLDQIYKDINSKK